MAVGCGGFAVFDGDSLTTSHVTPAASTITQAQKTAMPIRPRTFSIAGVG